jgi:hypothetical protein
MSDADSLLGPDGPYVDPLGNTAVGAGEPALAEVGSPEHRAALEEIYGPHHDSWEMFEMRANGLGVSVEDYAYGVREALQAELESRTEPDDPPEGYPHLDWMNPMPARPWSDEDFARDRLRAEQAAKPKELGGGGILALADLDRRTWEAHVEQGIDPISTLARTEREERQRVAAAHLAQSVSDAQENHQRKLEADRVREERQRETRELIERETRRRGPATVKALQRMGQLPRMPRLMR